MSPVELKSTLRKLESFIGKSNPIDNDDTIDWLIKFQEKFNQPL